MTIYCHFKYAFPSIIALTKRKKKPLINANSKLSTVPFSNFDKQIRKWIIINRSIQYIIIKYNQIGCPFVLGSLSCLSFRSSIDLASALSIEITPLNIVVLYLVIPYQCSGALHMYVRLTFKAPAKPVSN